MSLPYRIASPPTRYVQVARLHAWNQWARRVTFAVAGIWIALALFDVVTGGWLGLVAGDLIVWGWIGIADRIDRRVTRADRIEPRASR
jgi:hypothetical protein